MKKCKYCKEEILEKVSIPLQKPVTDKIEIKKIYQLSVLRSNGKICEYCYLKKVAALTNDLRIKAELYAKKRDNL